MKMGVRKFVDGLYQLKADGEIIGAVLYKPELSKRYCWSAYYYPQGYVALKKALGDDSRTHDLIESSVFQTKKLAVQWIERQYNQRSPQA